MTETNKPTYSKTIESVRINLDSFTDNEMFLLAILIEEENRVLSYLSKTNQYLTTDISDARVFSSIEKADALFLLSRGLDAVKSLLSVAPSPNKKARMSVMVLPYTLAENKVLALQAVADDTVAIVPDGGQKPKATVPHPDFFNGFYSLTTDRILTDIANESIWQVTDKIRASGQFTAKQHGVEMRYKYSFNGLLPADELIELNDRVNVTGWYDRVVADVKGEGIATYTVITFVLKVQHESGSHLSL